MRIETHRKDLIIRFDDLESQHANRHHLSHHFPFFYFLNFYKKQPIRQGHVHVEPLMTSQSVGKESIVKSAHRIPDGDAHFYYITPIFEGQSCVNITKSMDKNVISVKRQILFGQTDRHMWDPHLWARREEIGGNVKWRTGMPNCQSRT